jgi:pSer/pThr/pTyr-binding forkhead associated (FHA) protein
MQRSVWHPGKLRGIAVTDVSYQLVVRKGPQPGQVFPLSSQNMSIGRDPMSDITLSDPEVSRYHAQLLQTEAGFQIQDMGSTNGTFIDGEHLGGQPATLTSGQTVQLGSGVVLLFEAVPEEDAMATVTNSSPDLLETEPEEETASADLSQAEDEPIPPAFEPEPASPSPAFEPPPPFDPSSGPLVAPGEGSGDSRRRRRTIIIVSIILLLCCCCAFLISGYLYWGDPLLNFLIDLGLMNWLRDLGLSI